MLAGSAALPTDATELSREHLEFFEKRVRPVLVERCYECHSTTAKKLKGGLALDTRAGVLKGGD
ncbi:MAG: c-type cytochrome domain-containing protein, partial [Limisphaerales bacterium]